MRIVEVKNLKGQRLIVRSDHEGIALIPAEIFEEKMKVAMEYASMTENK